MDKINGLNSYNGYSFPSKGVNKDETVLTNEVDIMNLLVPKAKEVLEQKAEKEVPENGLFKHCFVTIVIPKSNNKGLISIEPDPKNPKELRTLIVGAHHKNRDRLSSNIMITGTKKEIMDYLKSDDNREEIVNSILELSKSVDDFYGAS